MGFAVRNALLWFFLFGPIPEVLKGLWRSEPKFYLYDILQIPKSETAKRLENLTALHLIKICHFWTDTGEGLFDLFFVRNKEKKEVDFLITKDRYPWMLIECKTQSKGLSSNLLYYSEKLKTSLNFQLIDDEKYDKNYRFQKVRVMGYEKFFSGLI